MDCPPQSKKEKEKKIGLSTTQVLASRQKMKMSSAVGFSFATYFLIYFSSIMTVQRTIEIIEITSRFVDHLATTTNTEASQRRAAIVICSIGQNLLQ